MKELSKAIVASVCIVCAVFLEIKGVHDFAIGLLIIGVFAIL